MYIPLAQSISRICTRVPSSGLVLLLDVGLRGSIHYYNGPDLVPGSQVQSMQYEVGTQLAMAMHMVHLRGPPSAR